MKLKLEKIEELIIGLKSYTNSTIELIKLETAQHTSSILANLISGLIVGLVFILFAFFLSLGICFYLSELLGNGYLGFCIVAGVYLLIGIFLLAGRKKLLIKIIRDRIIHEIFQKTS
jgi:uncharacterized RDD family membrane protein YckC